MGVEELKNKILELAIRGKLVPQDPTDEPASELLKKINKEKEKLIESGKIRRTKPLPPISEGEKPFDIPEGWEWVRITDICNVRGGKRIPKGLGFSDKETKHAYLRVTNMKKGTILDDDIKYISEAVYNKINKYTISSDDLYITIAGTIGAVGRIPDKYNNMNLTENASKLSFYGQGKCDLDFIRYSIESGFVQNQFRDKVNKMAQPKLSLRSIASTIIPLPPLSEQKRIVEKIDELFTLIDKLDKDKEDLLSNIESTREKVLQLALEGKLVPQDPSDEPASELLKEINLEKEKLVKAKKIRRGKPLPEITEEEKPFDIPDGWEWVRLGEISKTISKGTTPKGGKSAYTNKGINFLRVENITDNYTINLSNIKLIKENTHNNELKRSIGEENDLLISIAGTLGRVALINEKHLPCNMNQAISFVRLFYRQVDVDLLKYFVSSPCLRDMMIKKTKTTAQPNLTLEIISNLVIPLPPLSEQKRIVEKIDAIMALLDRLEEEINGGDELLERLPS